MLIDEEIILEEFITILKKKDKYDKMKDNLRSENKIYEIMRLSSISKFFGLSIKAGKITKNAKFLSDVSMSKVERVP